MKRRTIEIISTFERTIGATSLAAAYVAALILIGMFALIIFEICLRTFFATSTHITEEFVAYGLASLVFLAFGYSLSKGSLIRVDIILIHLPPKVRARVEMAIILVTIAAVIFMERVIWAHLVRDWNYGSVSWSPAAIPLWIPQAIVFVGLVIFCLQLTAYLFRLLRGGEVVGGGERLD